MADTVKLHYTECGRGRPVILIHGFPLDHTIWEAQAGALHDSFRVITPDLRGHGASPVPGGVYGMDQLAGDVFALMDHLDLDRAAWIGHSMGGYVTLAGLRLFPERIAGVGLVATHPYADPPDKRIQRGQSADMVLEKGVSELALSMMAALFAPDTDRQGAMAQRIYRVMLETSPVGVAGSQRGMAERPDSVEILRKLGVPAMVIAGVQDKIVTVGMAQDMAGTIPRAHLTLIDGAGHLPMVEQPDATTLALRRFLQALDFD
ncbi:MAG: alpha/beta fold hydrolase [Anaerolineae bacterium]|nr:alpha/beta fold hydrolase [Anaerolineae bacterium]